MIKHWVCTGDTHGKNRARLEEIILNIVEPKGYEPIETAVIILGDAGYNFYFDKKEDKAKMNTYNMKVYCVRGNHEERPENLGYEMVYDSDVDGFVYEDPINCDICYFMDGEDYVINGLSTLVIGGAYSVDKYYRIEKAEKYNLPLTWFEDEQLSADEMERIEHRTVGRKFDLVLSHTCPLDWEPIDLFLPSVDQSKVDKTMEKWLNSLKDTFSWKVWLFGHFHDDRVITTGVEMLYKRYEELDWIWEYWDYVERIKTDTYYK